MSDKDIEEKEFASKEPVNENSYEAIDLLASLEKKTGISRKIFEPSLKGTIIHSDEVNEALKSYERL